MEKFRTTNRVQLIVAAAACVAVVVPWIGQAQAYDILSAYPPPPPPQSYSPPPSQGYSTPPAQSYSPPAPASFGMPMDLRIEGGVGYNNGGTDTTISGPAGSASTNLFGGGGIAAEAAIWSDGALLRNVSLGAQYLHFSDSMTATASSSVGPIFGLTSATGNLSLNTDAMMLDAAWRPDIEGFHPFLGTGIGMAFTTLSGSALGFSARDSQAALAGQAFLGFDYDITSNIYAGVTGRFFISEATYHAPIIGPINIDVTNRPISLMAHFGLRF